VSLFVTTDQLCTADFTQKVFILPYTTFNAFPYYEDFEGGTGGWVSSADLTKANIDTSWVWGTPTGSIINSASSGTKAWWTGRNNGSYFDNETSWIDGPCFDFSQLERPMISFDMWTATDDGLDGAVLQYSTDGGFTWIVVGNLNSQGGFNWYNAGSISSKPGNQQFGLGWTGVETGWTRVSHDLDVLKGVANVRFRIAFGSNADNAPNQDFDGFAFDNVWIGDRARNVLVEHFTNINDGFHVATVDKVRDLQTARAAAGISDLIPIQYHINVPDVDPYNRDNPADPSSRTIVYGVNQAGWGIIDGNQYSGNILSATDIDINKRALIDPQFDIAVTELSAVESDISIRTTITSRNDLVGQQLVVHNAVVEEEILNGSGTVYYNVLRKLMPDAAGTLYTQDWNTGGSATFDLTWPIDVKISDATKLAVITFIQNRATREIYQTIITQLGDKMPPLIVGLEEDIKSRLNQANIYPNPVDQYLNVEIPNPGPYNYTYKIVDQRGVTINQGDVELKGNLFEMEVSEINNGIYFLVIGVENRPFTYKKIAVMHR
jgi:hypothetical protein